RRYGPRRRHRRGRRHWPWPHREDRWPVPARRWPQPPRGAAERTRPRCAWRAGASSPDPVPGDDRHVRMLLPSIAMGAHPQRVIHADWSVGPNKRWAARAELQPGGRYLVGTPAVVTPTELLVEARRGSTLIGFDFPIGLPAAYAKRVG